MPLQWGCDLSRVKHQAITRTMGTPGTNWNKILIKYEDIFSGVLAVDRIVLNYNSFVALVYFNVFNEPMQ